MATYRTAMGKTVDMAALTARNEKTRAVGNMKVNARGDTIDAAGKIIKSATSKVNDSYNKTVGNRSAQPTRNRPKPAPIPVDATPTLEAAELTEIERELEMYTEDDVEVEAIKSKELKGKKWVNQHSHQLK